MTYKWIGAVLVLVSCGGFGFAIASGYRREEQRLRQLLRALQYMECELQYHLTPLPDLCRQAGMETGGCVREVLNKLARELESQIAPDVSSCMRVAIEDYQDFSKRFRRLMLQLGKTLGRFDLAGQIQGLQAVQTSCIQEQKALEQNRDMRLRSYRTLGLCAGAALAILFA